MNLAVCLTTAGTIVAGAGLTLAQLPAVEEAIRHSERVDRLGIVGILTLLLAVSVLGNVWLLRSGVLKLVAMIESLTALVTKAMSVLECATASVEKLTATSAELKHITETCSMTHRAFELGRRAYDPGEHGGHHA